MKVGVKRLLHDAKSGENGTEPLRFGNRNRLCTLLPPSLSYESRMEAAFCDSQTVCRLRGPHGRAPKACLIRQTVRFASQSHGQPHINSRRPKEILLFVSMRCEELFLEQKIKYYYVRANSSRCSGAKAFPGLVNKSRPMLSGESCIHRADHTVDL
jgi:hypothetical protein